MVVIGAHCVIYFRVTYLPNISRGIYDLVSFALELRK